LGNALNTHNIIQHYPFLPKAQIHPLPFSATTRTSEKPAPSSSSRCSPTLRSFIPVRCAYFSARSAAFAFDLHKPPQSGPQASRLEKPPHITRQVRPPIVSLYSRHQIEHTVQIRQLRNRRLPDLHTARIDLPRIEVFTCRTLSAEWSMPKTFPSVAIAANLLTVLPPRHPTSRTVSVFPTATCSSPQSVTFECREFIDHKTNRPNNPDSLWH
jgi:hypothetical protein